MLRRLVSTFLVVALCAVPTAVRGQASGRFQLTSSTSGSRAKPGAKRFAIEDPRVEFQAGKDRQIVVMFEWQGPAGRHHCEGTWRDPSGHAVFTSDAEVDARTPRFAVYWSLSIPDTVAVGTWVLEARVDGEPAGSHSFQVVADPSSPAQAARLPTVGELYERAQARTMAIEVLDATRTRIARASGFFLSPEILLTSLSAINGARSVRAVRAEGIGLDTTEVVGWNRGEDWVLLRFAGAAAEPPSRSETPVKVGDRCFFLDVVGDARVLIDTAVVGFGADGEMMIGEYGSDASHGGAVWNDKGEVVAFLAGSSVAGATAFDLAGTSLDVMGLTTRGKRAKAVPKLPSEAAAARRLEDLAADGVFVSPIVRSPHVVGGILGTGVEKRHGVPVARDQRFVFTRADRQCAVFVTWNPSSKEDALAHFAVFDYDNKPIGTSGPQKLKLRSGVALVQFWAMDLASLKPGIYRVDVVKGQDPVWRTFFRLAD